MPGLPHVPTSVRRALLDSPIATLTDVDISGNLASRSRPSPDYEHERDALALLAAELAGNRDVLQKIAEVALDLCAAHTAGITLRDGDRIRWEAVAGVLASARGRILPADESPWSVCIERDDAVLLHLPDRSFGSLDAESRFVEMLLVPFHDRGQAIGTVWVASHSAERRFDREDARVVRVLAWHASAGWQLRRARETAADPARRAEHLLAVLGHELRNPLCAISAATAALARHVSDAGADAHALEVIARQTRVIERLASDLLDNSRLASGKLRLDARPVDLWLIVAECLETCRTKIERRRLQVSLELPQGPAIVHGDTMRLAQLFSNLIDNATKFTPECGQVAIGGSLDRDHASVSIRDTGIGMPRDQIQHVFEPFAQLIDPHDSTATIGLGLGLSLVRSLAELHGGTVAADSDGIGRGSCFVVRLPLHAHSTTGPTAIARAS